MTSVSKSDIELVTINKNPNKKCGLIWKSGACVSRGSREDSCHATSESMASKICPVCKTFSSASNTTLNAHIDQCLSIDSAPLNSKQNRHRIKPRKIRPMTDIYATAKSCTLEEEIEKISGNSGCTDDKDEVLNKRKNRKVLPVHLDGDAGCGGSVYIDASGRKLRILSEFNGNTSSVLREHMGNRVKKISPREGKGSKCFSSKKKSHRQRNNDKFLKYAPQSRKSHWQKNNHKYFKVTQSRKLSSCKASASEQILERQDGYAREGSDEEKLQIPKQLKLGQPGTLNWQMLAKRTGFSRKVSRKGHKFHVSQDQRFENKDSWLRDSMVARNPTYKSVDLFGSAVSFPLGKRIQVTRRNGTLFGCNRAQRPYYRFGKIESKETTPVMVQQDTQKTKKRTPSLNKNSSAGKSFSVDTVKSKEVSSSATSGRNMSSAAKASKLSVSEDKFSKSESMAVWELKKGWSLLHLSGEGDEDGEMGKWESDMDQDCGLTDNDSDDSEMDQEPSFREHSKTDEDMMSRDFSICGDDDESCEDAKIGNDGFDKINEAETVFLQSDTPPSTEIYNGNAFPGGKPMNYTEGVGQGGSFMEVDPVTIPGPLGSFLPSPRGIGSDDFPGNSSMITSHVQSSQNQLDLVDRNSSESPVSMASANSNSVACRSDPAKLSSIQEKVSASYSTSTINSGASSQETNSGVEWTSTREKLDLHSISINNDQPWCCQRKKSSESIITVSHLESQLLKQRTASSNSDTVLDSTEPQSFRDSDLQRKFSNSSINHTFVSPSNSVLRLMGKNLMVVNQEKEASMPAASRSRFYHAVPQLSWPLLQSPCTETSLSFSKSNCFGNHVNSTAPKTQRWASADALAENFGTFSPR